MALPSSSTQSFTAVPDIEPPVPGSAIVGRSSLYDSNICLACFLCSSVTVGFSVGAPGSCGSTSCLPSVLTMQSRPISEFLQRYSYWTARNRVRPNKVLPGGRGAAEQALQVRLHGRDHEGLDRWSRVAARRMALTTEQGRRACQHGGCCGPTTSGVRSWCSQRLSA